MPEPSSAELSLGRFRLALDRPRLMGVLNLTPDSFYDGGRYVDAGAALDRAAQMVAEGADILDIGAESTRPGAEPIDAKEELRRLMPVLPKLLALGVPVSVDTRRPGVMREVIAAGVHMINDVDGFASLESVAAVADSTVACCVMHMQGEPLTMQAAPVYQDVTNEVREFLYLRSARLVQAGLGHDRVVVDPGIGFGKTADQNLRLLADTARLCSLGFPLLVGVSRKSLIGAITGRSLDQRLAGGLGLTLAAVSRGARLLRVHDVAPTRDAIDAWLAVESGHLESGS